MAELFDIFGFDIFDLIWNFIQSIAEFIVTVYNILVTLFSYVYIFNPVVAGIMIVGFAIGALFGILKIIKLIPLA